jgi:cell division topological specificity factor
MDTMLRQLMHLLRQQEKTSGTARRRLSMVLVMDRVGLAPRYMEEMRNEIVAVVSNYLQVEPESMELQVRREGDSIMLVSNIPVRRLDRNTSIEADAELEAVAAD